MVKKSNREWEQGFFFVILVLHSLPILLLTPFVTLDGPAHLYNAHLMFEVLFGKTPVIHSFFEFNTFPEPNWTGHFLLMVLQAVLPILWAEKVIILLIFVLMAYGFRKLIMTIQPDSAYLSWMIFPFLFNFPLLLGFFNFVLALALLPWWINWWLKNHNAGLHVKNGILVTLFFMVLYFSHLVVFLLAGLSAGIISIFHSESGYTKKMFKQLLYLFIVTMPGLFLSFLFVFFFGTDGYRGEISYLPVAQLIDDLFCSRMFIVYDYTSEKVFTYAFSGLMGLLTVIGLRHFNKTHIQRSFGWICLSSLLLIFIIPDSLASGGILSVRLVQWFYMTWCIWLVTLSIPQKAKIFTAVIAVGFSFGMMKIHWKVQQELNGDAQQFIETASHIEPNSIVLPLNYSSNWMHSNMSSYLGIMKDVVVLDNYEATQHHFPLVWKKNMDPEIHMGNHVSSNRPCVDIEKSEKMTGLKINYVSVWQRPSDLDDSCSLDIIDQLRVLKFRSIRNSNSLELFSQH
ncbi:MAG: hypothetical protein IPO63_12980 [Bacteroidetes bacterium]|nr:hypothetical protein [Bacteroidota bacterium]